MMYAWASPDYLLDHMTIEQIFLYYDQGIKLLNGTAKSPIRFTSPDLAGFNRAYGNRIKRPSKGG